MNAPTPERPCPKVAGMDVDEAARIIRAAYPNHRVELVGGPAITAMVDRNRIAIFYDRTTRLVRGEPSPG